MNKVNHCINVEFYCLGTNLDLGIVIAGTMCVSVVSTPFALSHCQKMDLTGALWTSAAEMAADRHITYLHPNIPLCKWGT